MSSFDSRGCKGIDIARKCKILQFLEYLQPQICADHLGRAHARDANQLCSIGRNDRLARLCPKKSRICVLHNPLVLYD